MEFFKQSITPPGRNTWDPLAPAYYRSEYVRYAGIRAISTAIILTIPTIALIFSHPPGTIDSVVLTPTTVTHQIQTRRPTTSPMPELSRTASSLQAYKDNTPKVIWVKGAIKRR